MEEMEDDMLMEVDHEVIQTVAQRLIHFEESTNEKLQEKKKELIQLVLSKIEEGTVTRDNIQKLHILENELKLVKECVNDMRKEREEDQVFADNTEPQEENKNVQPLQQRVRDVDTVEVGVSYVIITFRFI